MNRLDKIYFSILFLLAIGGVSAMTAYSTVEVGPAPAGAGTGDLLSTNNLSDVASATTSRANLIAAKSGSNSDITALSALATALSVLQGGTGATTASDARTSLGAAMSGSNMDILSLDGLTNAITLAQGGTSKSLTAINGGVPYSDADSLEMTAAGTSGQVLTSNGAAAPTWENAGGSLQGAYGGGASISVNASPDGPIQISGDSGSVPQYVMHVDVTNGSAAGIFMDRSTALGAAAIDIEMPNAANSFAGLYVYYGGTAALYNGAIVGEVPAGDVDAMQAIIDAGATGRNLALAYSTDVVGISALKTGFTSYDLTLPPDDGNAGEFMKTDGSGVLTWARPAPVRESSTSTTSATCSKTCTAGVLSGGGCESSGTSVLIESYPSSTTAWSCTYADAISDCTAYAICL